MKIDNERTHSPDNRFFDEDKIWEDTIKLAEELDMETKE